MEWIHSKNLRFGLVHRAFIKLLPEPQYTSGFGAKLNHLWTLVSKCNQFDIQFPVIFGAGLQDGGCESEQIECEGDLGKCK